MEKGALFGKYEVGRLLGCGAFAKVYYGRNTKTGLSVAIKVISKKKIPGSTLMNNIKREISIMSRLRHPNIVKLYEVLASKSKIYFVMEYVKGGELFTKVAKGRFSEDLSRKYFQQLVSAVGYCHSRGIYHRDLKPENVLVDENGDLKVSDFGLSAVVTKDHAAVLQTLCGTPAYVAPEILAKKGYEGAKVDVWSCGVILYVLTAGYLPFHDPNLMAMYKKIYRGEYKCPKWMSSDLRHFLSRLLESNPSSRITMNAIVGDPWFTKGGSFTFPHSYFYNPNGDDDVKDEENLAGFLSTYSSDSDSSSSSSSTSSSSSSLSPLNAFHLISFSSGLDLSGLFHESVNPTLDVNAERFVSTEPGTKIGEKIEEVAKEENIKVKIMIKDYYCRVELESPDGNMVAKVDIRPLTADLVVVEVKKSGGDQSTYQYNEIWEKKIRPQLCSLVYIEDGVTQNIPRNQAEIVPTPKHAASGGGAF